MWHAKDQSYFREVNLQRELSGFTLRLIPTAIAAALVCACSMPRDPLGTMDRVEQTRTLRLGMVETAKMDEPSRRTLQRILHRTGAALQVSRGDSEDLLSQVEQGKIDLVFGEFPRSSPWKKSVYLSSAQGRLGKPPKDVKVPRFATMKGENGWIMLIEKASR